MSTYDYQMLVRNIYYLARQKGIRIYEIEEAADACRGQLSRMKKNGLRPSVHFVIAAAKTLDVSLDALLLQDLTQTQDAQDT